MKFKYRSEWVQSAETGEEIQAFRPEVYVRVAGPLRSTRFLGLVDTGADKTMLPASLAEVCGVALTKARGPAIIGLGGKKLRTFFGDVQLGLKQGRKTITWTACVLFHKFKRPEDECLLLGHSGFLDYFTATFDGESHMLSLVPNDRIPKVARRLGIDNSLRHASSQRRFVEQISI